eukprot:4354920-Pleurochrysis_carterae.AAC.1
MVRVWLSGVFHFGVGRTPCRGPRWVVLTSHTSPTVSTKSQIRKYHFLINRLVVSDVVMYVKP